MSADGIAAMARHGTVAVLLPGAFYFLRETRSPPVDALREAGVRMAVATDCNPGTSPLTSLLTAMNMACTLFRLTPHEALAGATINAAHALGLQTSVGSLQVGKNADFALVGDRTAGRSCVFDRLQSVSLRGAVGEGASGNASSSRSAAE